MSNTISSGRGNCGLPDALARRSQIRHVDKILRIFNSSGLSAFQYFPEEDTLILYDNHLCALSTHHRYLATLETQSHIHPEDRWKATEFFSGRLRKPIELRMLLEDGSIMRWILDGSYMTDPDTSCEVFLGSIRDITLEKQRSELLEEQAMRDSLTRLYNHYFGKELINEYLSSKNPYSSCGMMVLDIDYFKNVNDTYGHLFGDQVLIRLSQLLTAFFSKKDILMRSGGDEFVILLKDITHAQLVNKSNQLLNAIRTLTFPEQDYSVTCSIGICFLPENKSGYTFDQLFENSDWALYQAKLEGRNRYFFCDTLQRFELSEQKPSAEGAGGIDARYFKNDVVSSAFEIFEKTNSFDSAIKLLLQVIGLRFQLDRITIIHTDTKAQNAGRQYQWLSPNAPEVLPVRSSFTKEDFLTLFHSYDEYDTVVLQHDNMSMYSPQGTALLMQGDAKTVLYAAMYCEGTYVGAISYVVCSTKRYWSKQNRLQLSELTKLISAHLAKKMALNSHYHSVANTPQYDSLTGLLSFSLFREETERIILGGYGTSHAMIYTDIEKFKLFNQKYGYNTGDWLLREFATSISEVLIQSGENTYFSRIYGDQFILFRPCSDIGQLEKIVHEKNLLFSEHIAKRFPGVSLTVRSGIYLVSPDCHSASEAIDAANYARKQLSSSCSRRARLYDEVLAKQQALELKKLETAGEA